MLCVFFALVRYVSFVVCLRVDVRLFVDCCLMYVVRCYASLFVAGRSIIVIRCLSCVVCCVCCSLLSGVRCLFFVEYCGVFECYMLLDVCCALFVAWGL